MPYPFYQNFYPQNNQQFVPQTQQVQSPFVNVRSEAEARNFPVGFGNVVCFKDENSPYVYTKAMGFSQSEKPVFEKYRREDVEEAPKEDFKEQLNNLEIQIANMQKEIDFLKERRRNNEHNGNVKPNQNESRGGVVAKI